MPSLRLLLACCLFLAPFATRASDTSPEDMLRPAPKGLPSEPAWGFWEAAPAAWLQTHEDMVRRSRRGGVDIVFLGDSITKGWKQAASENWTGADTPPVAVNYGIGGDSTRQLLWRIDHGLLDGIQPRLVVLMIGTNNLYQDQNGGTAGEIADGVDRVIARIREKAPAARVLLLGVLPRQTKYWCDRIRELNTLLAARADPGRVDYHDFWNEFADERGLLKAPLFQNDRVHLGAAGYETLTAGVKPLVQAALR